MVFSKDALMWSYLKKVVKNNVVNKSANTMQAIIAGVPRDSIYGPLIFNLFKNDLELFIQYMVSGNYADDNIFSLTGSKIEVLKKVLPTDF